MIESFHLSPLTHDSHHEYRLGNQNVSIVFDRAYIDDFGTAHLYADGTVIATVELAILDSDVINALRRLEL